MGLGAVAGERIATEISRWAAQHGMGVVGIVGGVVVLDEQIVRLDPVVVTPVVVAAGSGRYRSLPGEERGAGVQAVGLGGGEIARQPGQVRRDELVEQG